MESFRRFLSSWTMFAKKHSTKTEYGSLPTTSSDLQFTDDGSIPEADHSEGIDKPVERSSSGSNLMHSLFLLSVATLLLSSWVFYKQQQTVVTDAACVERMSAYSPLHEAIEYKWSMFENRFIPDQYSGYPTDHSEAAWDRLWNYGGFSFPAEKLPLLNKSSVDGDYRQLKTEEGGGVAGLLEGAHQIHCLNLVRQFIYRDFWDYSDIPSFSGGEKIRRHHVDHCISTLLMNIQCISDTTLYVVENDPSSQGGLTEWNAPRKCRNFENLVTWMHEHQLFDSPEE